MFLRGGLDEDVAAERTEARMKRRARVDGPDTARVTALIFEFALHRLVGTPEVMVGSWKTSWSYRSGATSSSKSSPMTAASSPG